VLEVVAPVAVEYLPTEQLTQAKAEVVEEYLPAAHALIAARPVDPQKLPTAHTMHSADSGLGWYEPPRHERQAEASTPEYFPEGQGAQVVEPYCPAVHPVGSGTPT
jgi:hypothetical protein